VLLPFAEALAARFAGTAGSRQKDPRLD